MRKWKRNMTMEPETWSSILQSEQLDSFVVFCIFMQIKWQSRECKIQPWPLVICSKKFCLEQIFIQFQFHLQIYNQDCCRWVQRGVKWTSSYVCNLIPFQCIVWTFPNIPTNRKLSLWLNIMIDRRDKSSVRLIWFCDRFQDNMCDINIAFIKWNTFRGMKTQDFMHKNYVTCTMTMPNWHEKCHKYLALLLLLHIYCRLHNVVGILTIHSINPLLWYRIYNSSMGWPSDLWRLFARSYSKLGLFSCGRAITQTMLGELAACVF
jgi:hypothetical protein